MQVVSDTHRHWPIQLSAFLPRRAGVLARGFGSGLLSHQFHKEGINRGLNAGVKACSRHLCEVLPDEAPDGDVARTTLPHTALPRQTAQRGGRDFTGGAGLTLQAGRAHRSLRNCSAQRASSKAASRACAASSLARAAWAHVFASISQVLPEAPLHLQPANQAAASASRGGPVERASLEGLVFTHQAFSFVPCRLVRRLVQGLDFFMEAAMEQIAMPLLQRLNGPAVVPPNLLKRANTYREAVRWCWQLRRVKWTPATLSAHYGFTRQHVGDWINPDDKPRRRSLPGECVQDFEDGMGNSFISQWHAMRAQLTVTQQLEAAGLAA